MIKIALVGTSWITNQVASGMIETGQYEVVGIMSRSQEKGQSFLKELGVEGEVFASIDQIAQSQATAVYIASPNGKHFENIVDAINGGLDVIVEKPIVSNVEEFEKVEELLQEHPHVRLFEAARHLHDPNFKIVQAAIKNDLGKVSGANLIYAKYSSKYDDYLNPDTPVPNVFNPEFSGGALYDLGVYPIYAAIGWFGVPQKAEFKPTMLETGTDGSGLIYFDYGDFKVNIFAAKNQTSYNNSEIYNLKNTITIDDVAELDLVQIRRGKQAPETISGPNRENPTYNESMAFAKVLLDRDNPENVKKYQYWREISKQVNNVMFELRTSAGIKFPADK